MPAQAGEQTGEPQVFDFQAEAVQILDLMIHSLYSNKEIFLRELISNASDAIDRLRLELVSRGETPGAEGSPRIVVSYDSDARTITVADNGIGMSRDEVVENIGTIAKSGTREFLRSLTGDERKDAVLIGQFGVGFYAAFLVADRVELTTRRVGAEPGEGVRWASDGKGQYSLEEAEVPEAGTTVTLHLREGEEDLLSKWRLRSIIEKYSDHISVPIQMPAEADDNVGAETADAETDSATETSGTGDSETTEKADKSDKEQYITVNRASALWTRPKSELTDSDYNEFFKHVAGEFTDPLAWVHARIEGTYEYTLLLFIPARAPFDLWMPEARRGVRLHVQRVFIMEDTGQILPTYLRFVKGVIDSSDLPLNVSREILQGSRAVDNMRSTATKRVLRRLAELAADEPEKYATFWREFGSTLKEGIPEDFTNRDEIAKLLRFTSTRSETDEPDTSLAQYVERMKDGQERIYYLLAPSLAAAKSSPHLEAFRAKGVEVLLLGDTVDNWVVSGLREFGGKQLQSVAQGAGDLSAMADEEEKQAKERADEEYAGLLAKLKSHLTGQASDVRLSTRLTASPACIVSNEPESDLTIAARLRGTGLPRQAILEINPDHPLIKRLNAGDDDARLRQWAQVLFSRSVLTFGARLENPAAFVGELNTLLTALTGDGTGEPAAGQPAAEHQAGAGTEADDGSEGKDESKGESEGEDG